MRAELTTQGQQLQQVQPLAHLLAQVTQQEDSKRTRPKTGPSQSQQTSMVSVGEQKKTTLCSREAKKLEAEKLTEDHVE